VKNQDFLTEDNRKVQERENLISALKSAKGRVSGKGGAAELLGIPATTLYSRLKRLNINVRQFRYTDVVMHS
jgi:transcriptional regulator of acetoin/glycerol metabolism